MPPSGDADTDVARRLAEACRWDSGAPPPTAAMPWPAAGAVVVPMPLADADRFTPRAMSASVAVNARSEWSGSPTVAAARTGSDPARCRWRAEPVPSFMTRAPSEPDDRWLHCPGCGCWCGCWCDGEPSTGKHSLVPTWSLPC